MRAAAAIRADVNAAATGFDDPATDLDLSASTAGGPLAATIVPVSTTEYTVEVTGMSADGDVIATIPAGAAADGATNPSTASTSSDNTVTYELPAAPLTIQVPADIVVYADPGDSGIAVDYPAATTTGGAASAATTTGGGGAGGAGGWMGSSVSATTTAAARITSEQRSMASIAWWTSALPPASYRSTAPSWRPSFARRDSSTRTRAAASPTNTA